VSDFSGLPPDRPKNWTASTATALVVALLLGVVVFVASVVVYQAFKDWL
jgi:hypothetical protein